MSSFLGSEQLQSTIEVINVNTNTNSYSAPLLESARQKYWMEALSPLKWILLPVGIRSSISQSHIDSSDVASTYKRSKCDKAWQIWSYIYILVYLSFPFLQLWPVFNSFLTIATEFERWLLYIAYGTLFISIWYLYYFARWYYINGNEYFQSLWLNLFNIISKCHINENTNDKNHRNDIFDKSGMLEKYRNHIYNSCRVYSICVWIAFGLCTACWLYIAGRLGEEFNPYRAYLLPILYDIQIWLPMFVLLAIFVVTMQILYLHYCVYSVRLYHTFDGCTLFENYRIFVKENINQGKKQSILNLRKRKHNHNHNHGQSGNTKNQDENEAIDFYAWFPSVLTVFTYDSTFSEFQCLNDQKNCIKLFSSFGEIKRKYFKLVLLFSKYSHIWSVMFIFQLLIFGESVVNGVLILFFYQRTDNLADIQALFVFSVSIFVLFMAYMIIIAYVNQSCDNLKKLLCLADCYFQDNYNHNQNINQLEYNGDSGAVSNVKDSILTQAETSGNNKNVSIPAISPIKHEKQVIPLRYHITPSDILYFHNLIDLHQCTFNVWGVQLTFSKVALLFIAGCSTVLSFGFQQIFDDF